jgi:uncharacterized membrane protein
VSRLRDNWLRAAIAATSAVGLGLAAYLTYVHYAHIRPLCTTGGCEKVQTSSYAELAGVPVAVLGLAAYATLLVVACLPGVWAALAGAVVAVGGAAFSGYLLWAQLARIHAICQWCVGNDGLILVVAALCVARVLLEPEDKRLDAG